MTQADALKQHAGKECPHCAGTLFLHAGTRVLEPHLRCNGCDTWWGVERHSVPMWLVETVLHRAEQLLPPDTTPKGSNWFAGNMKAPLHVLERNQR